MCLWAGCPRPHTPTPSSDCGSSLSISSWLARSMANLLRTLPTGQPLSCAQACREHGREPGHWGTGSWMFLLPLNVLCTQTPITIQMPRIEATSDKAVCLQPRHPSLISAIITSQHVTTVRKRLTASRVPSDMSTMWPWDVQGLPERGTAHPQCVSGDHMPWPRLRAHSGWSHDPQ